MTLATRSRPFGASATETQSGRVKGPVFCFPGVVSSEDLRPLAGDDSPIHQPAWRDRLSSAPHWLRAQIQTVAVGVSATLEMRRHGIEPAVITSHSLGIYAALFAAGSIDAESALSAAWRAGELLERNLQGRPAGLLAVLGLARNQVEDILRKVGGTLRIASCNTGSQFVLGGSVEDLALAEEEAKDALKVERIEAGGALHTEMVGSVVPELVEFAAHLDVRDPRRPYLCHRGATYLSTAAEVREALAWQIREPVLWSDCLVRLGDEGAWLFVDMGPGSVLQKSVRWVLREARALALAGGDSPEAIRAALHERAVIGEDGN